MSWPDCEICGAPPYRLCNQNYHDGYGAGVEERDALKAEVEELLIKIDGLTAGEKLHYERADKAEAALASSQARVERLKEVWKELRRYGFAHFTGCDTVANGIDGDCPCGLRRAQKRLEALASHEGADKKPVAKEEPRGWRCEACFTLNTGMGSCDGCGSNAC